VEESLQFIKGLFLQAFFLSLSVHYYTGYFTEFYEIMPDLYITVFFSEYFIPHLVAEGAA